MIDTIYGDECRHLIHPSSRYLPPTTERKKNYTHPNIPLRAYVIKGVADPDTTILSVRDIEYIAEKL